MEPRALSHGRSGLMHHLHGIKVKYKDYIVSICYSLTNEQTAIIHTETSGVVCVVSLGFICMDKIYKSKSFLSKAD